ncbi:TonB-dependent receptor [Novosphingobium flavum]|uniref:TonB-dependent receptor n=1 Tax=Novosphingobium flavum TaxID=1778672 RepID=A0A7X1KM31_9SPHN|nr:TonB-dependent receptor [Novosphingobium flavum]MBC2666206.1 TonB-dependent receptor [Novosphingobium flavum]
MHSFVRSGLLAATALGSALPLQAHAEEVPASAAPIATVSATVDAAGADSAAVDGEQRSSAGTGATDQGDIVVTARHRNETSQSVPLAIAVVGGDHIDNTGAFNVGRLQQLTPTLQFYSSNPRNTSVNVRGFGAPLGLTNDGIDQGVGIYVDDVYYSRVASSTFDFLDVAQIEVLRGPQGTLYGKNTTAGAINITSRQPTFDPEGRAEVSFGNYGYVQAKAAVSGPLSDTLAARIAISETKRNGTIWNSTTNKWNNDQSNTGLRAQLLWKAASNLEVSLAGDWSHQNTLCCATVFYAYVPTQKGVLVGGVLNRQYPALYDVAAGKAAGTNAYLTNPANQGFANRISDVDGELRAKQSIGGASLRAKLDLGAGTLTSISAWRFWNWDPSNDRDFTALRITTKSQNPSKQQQFTQELRYNQHSDALDFQLGTFYYYQVVNTNGYQEQGAAATKWLLSPSSDPANVYNLNVLNGLNSTNTIRLANTSWSVYGQASWRPLPGLTIQPGARVNYDKKSGSYNAVVRDAAGNLLTPGMVSTGTPTQKAQIGVLLPESYAPSFSAWNLSYDLTLSYDIAPDVHTYATYSKTFQTGGINLNGVPADATTGLPQTQYQTVAPEGVHHFELGIKSQFFDRKVTLNLAAFRTDISNYQAVFSSNNAASLSTLRGYVANVPKVRSQGIEADFSVRPSERFNAYANFAYTDATYREFTNAPPPIELSGGSTFSGTNCTIPTALPANVSPVSCNISGQQLPGVSKYSLSLGGEGNLPVKFFGKDGQIFLGADGNTRSSFSSNATPSPAATLPGYTLVNFRFGWRSDRDDKGRKIDVYGWVRNAFDKGYVEQLQVAPNSVGLLVANIGDPRTFGGTVKVEF